jgi:hypothetical protein
MSHDLRYFVGLDLGQVSDFTAIAVLCRPAVDEETAREQRRPAYQVPHLERLPLGTPYPEVVQHVMRLMRTPALNHCLLAVDQTGVGRAVVDMLADELRGQVNCKFQPITITAGYRVNPEKGLHVPKKELVGVLQMLLQTRRLQVARLLPDAGTLMRELENFRVKITAARNEVYKAWREGAHDDLVLATGLAAWCAEKALPPLIQPPRPSQYSDRRGR